MHTYKKSIQSIVLLTAMLLFLLSGCTDTQEQTAGTPPFVSYKDIPGLSQEELRSIEQILQSRDSFSYAMMFSTEAFYDSSGNINGYSKVFAEYLTMLFDTPFVPAIVTFEELLTGLEDGSLDFTGTLTVTPERRQIYHMTDAIAQRTIKLFRLKNSEPADNIRQSRTPVYAMLGRSASIQTVRDFAFYDIEFVFIDEYLDAYELLRSGDIDALLAESSAEAVFEDRNDIITENFFPMINSFVSFTAKSDDLAPIVNAVQKMLDNGGEYYIAELYEAGYHEYLKHKLILQLTPGEREYIKNNPVIAFGAEFDNYPISFFDERSGSWQGIAIDVMEEICRLTDMEYSVINEAGASFNELLGMLETGEINVISELIVTPERQTQFLWPDRRFINDNSVLISRTGYHTINYNRIFSEVVGLVKNTAHTEFFNTWFPNHSRTVMFEDHILAMEALKNGEIDLVMTSYSTILYFSNYLEETVYAPGFIFDNNFKSTFGIGKDYEMLLSVMDKALELVDVDTVSDHWLHKTYDYRISLAEQNNTLFRGMILVMFCVLLLVVALLIRNYHMNRHLGELVDERTRELALSVEEISKARDEAQIANKSKSFFLANMSHEIRTPMNAISGITEIILQKEDIPDDVKDGLDRIAHSCNLLMGIINDILDLSKIEAGKLDINNKEYNTASLINDSAQLNMMRIGSKPVRFTLDADENIPARLIGDELRIKQIMNNLLSNAFKYTESGEVKLSVKAEENESAIKPFEASPKPFVERLGNEKSEIRGKEAGEKGAQENIVSLIISVRDSGCGMTGEQVSRLFDEYVRFNEDGPGRLIEGTGLGLPITRQLVTLMGGEIMVESKKGEGSLFTVILPQGRVDDEVLGKEVKENLTSFKMRFGMTDKRQSILREPMPYGSVLVVDDVEANLYVAIGLLKPYKLSIDTVRSGSEAIDLIDRGKKYDVVFMDHMMPDMDGVETTKILRKKGYAEPVIALTANAVAGQSDMFIENGFDDFVSKPIDVRQLNAILNKYIRDKQPQDVINKAHSEYEKEKANGHLTSTGNGHKTAKHVIGSNDNPGNSRDMTALYIFKNKKADGIDIPGGLEKYDNDETVYLKILSAYTANMIKLLEDIRALLPIGKENADEYRLKVHSIKGTSLDIYADEIGNTAAALENFAKSGEYDSINNKTPDFIKTAEQLTGQLQMMLSEIRGANPKEIKDRPDTDILTKLKDACEMYSMDGVNKAMDEIEKYSYNADEGLAAWLREKVNIMGFAQIAEKLEEVIKEAG